MSLRSRNPKTFAKAAFIFGLCLALAACGGEPDRQFNPKDWAATREEQRYVFTQDLIDRKLLLGKSEGGVIELLGQPSGRIPYAGESRPLEVLSYIVKNTKGLSASAYISLDVEFNADTGLAKGVVLRPD